MKIFRKQEQLPFRIGQIDPDSAVLFIHGLAGSYWTWDMFSKHLEENWHEPDSFGLEYEEYYGEQHFIYRIKYVNLIPRWFKVLVGKDIFALSESLNSSIEVLCKDYKNVVIVAHSMGGLIARRFIVDHVHKHKDTGKVRGLITYATPHWGSKTANYVGSIGSMIVAGLNLIIVLALLLGFSWLFFQHPFLAIIGLSLVIAFGRLIRFNLGEQIFQLRKGDGFIEKLNQEWSDLDVDGRIDFKRVVGYEDWVVDVNSSAFKEDDNVIKISNKGHFTIIKPDRVKDKAFQVTYNYLKDFRAEQEKKAELEESIAAANDGELYDDDELIP